jgi:hypothetical protein
VGADRSTQIKNISLFNRYVDVEPFSLAVGGAGGRVVCGRRGGRGHEGSGRASARGRAHYLPNEDNTGRKAAFSLDALVRPGYSRLLEFIKKNQLLQ